MVSGAPSMKARPAIETRVVDTEDPTFVGTVVELDANPEWVFVRWDHEPEEVSEAHISAIEIPGALTSRDLIAGVKLVGIHEIAESLGISRQRADQISREGHFPKPVAELKMGRIWRLSDFEKWKEKRGR